MRKNMTYKVFALFIFCLIGTNIFGQYVKKPEPPTTRILFILDGSQSMSGVWDSDKKFTIARTMLSRMIDSLEKLDNVEMALRVYGHQSPVPPQDCEDSKLEVPFSPNNATRIRHKLRFITPKGTTPIAYSLKEAEKDFRNCDNCRNIIVLITDGIESCEGDPCEVSRYLQSKGITLKPFVVGIGYDPEFQKTFQCVGQFYNATKEDKFEEILGVVISQALNSTSAQINLLDEVGNPTETNIPMTFYSRTSGKALLKYVHTINHYGVSDTIYLDPLVNYRVKIHTLPPLYIDSVQTTPGKHSVFAIKSPTGFVTAKVKGGNLFRDLQYLIKKPGTNEILAVKSLGDTQRMLTGNYDMEFLTTPPLQIDSVEIKQSHTTTLEIPQPGIVTIQKPSDGFGGIYKYVNGELQHVIDLKSDVKNESLILLPGEYCVIFRSKNIKSTLYSVNEDFTVVSGSSLPIQLF